MEIYVTFSEKRLKVSSSTPLVIGRGVVTMCKLSTHLRRGHMVRGHFRSGRWVPAHYRTGTVVNAHCVA